VTEGQSRPSHRGPAVLGLVMFVIAAAAALSVDVPRTGYGIKSDEATYVAAALSAAYDRDLAFDKKDLERFAGLYHSGPDGIFLKRGKELKIRLNGTAPFLHMTKREAVDQTKLYFGKAIAYPMAAAPFVWLLGLNGMLLFQVVLLAVVVVTAYLFMTAQSPSLAAATFTAAFLGATVLPVYGVFLMPEIFNFTLVFVAFFLWLYKEVAPASRLNAPWTDVAAVVLLGIGTYSKPLPIALLVVPIVLVAILRRQWIRTLTLGAIAVAVASLFFAFNASVSGEFNYQGGDRKTFVERYPFDGTGLRWDQLGGGVIDDPGAAAQSVLFNRDVPRRFALNVKYFLLGRHFGFIPYFFPGAVAIAVWLLSPARRDLWRIAIFASAMLSIAALLLVLPITWSGGGGPPGNRYFFNVYPVLFFLMPATPGPLPGVIAWIGGALFVGKMLMNPFAAAKFTWLIAEKGPLRRLPVELTLANDLPVQLAQPLRGHVAYGPRDERGMLLYFLDQNAWPPEPQGMWLSGAGRADIIVRTVRPVDHLIVECESPIHTVLTMSMGADSVTVTLEPHTIQTVNVPASGVHGARDYVYLLSARSTEAFVPHLVDPANQDYRNLSAQLRFQLAPKM
jgi:hypothetical protein